MGFNGLKPSTSAPVKSEVAEVLPVIRPMPSPPLTQKPLTALRFAILDTETTGPDPHKDEVIEVAVRGWYLNRRRRAPFVYESYVNPNCLIPPSAIAVHHITNDKVAQASQLEEAMEPVLALVQDSIPVAYNAEYDRCMLRETPLHDRYWLDIYRLAMKTWSIGEKNADGFALTSFKQQELRYWLGLRNIEGDAHRAAADIHVTGLVFQVAVDRYLEKGMADDADEFLTWLESPILHKTLPFGPFAGKTPEQLEDYEIRRAFDKTKPIYESLVRFNVLDYLEPEKMRRALSDNPTLTRRSVLGHRS